MKAITDKYAALWRFDSAVWPALQANGMLDTDVEEFHRLLLMQQVSAHRTLSFNLH